MSLLCDFADQPIRVEGVVPRSNEGATAFSRGLRGPGVFGTFRPMRSLPTSDSLQDDRRLVLCVEDDAYLRADIVEELHAAGFHTIEASDGAEALDRIADCRPDLVLCDITMPRMDGHELFKRMRDAKSGLAEIPYIFLTARDTREDVLAGKRSGADDYLVKPIDFDLMIASIEARIARTRDLQMHDDDVGRAGTGGNAELTRRVLDQFGFGVVIVEEDGRVVFANTQARRMSDRTGSFYLRDRMRLFTSGQTAQLRARITAVAAADAGADDDIHGMTFEREDAPGDTLSLICMSLGAENGDARVAIVVSDPVHPVECPQHLLGALFGLTPAETLVVQGLVRGRQRAEVAAALGVSQTTIAFHMRNIFDKTGTSRQAELVARVMNAVAAIA
jgi:DNA-binding NarL/FixJ family response regulator